MPVSIASDAEKQGFDRNEIWNLSLLVLGAILVGGRLGYLVVEFFRTPYYREHPLEILKFWKGGLMFYGGFILTFITVVWYARVKKLPILKLTDLYAVGGILGNAIGRWGCFFAGDDYGKPAPDLPWAVTFTDPRSFAPKGIPLHPTQLYMSLNSFLIFLLVRWVAKHKKFDGQVTAVLLMVYAVGRSIIELYRGDADRGFLIQEPFTLSSSQFVSVVGFVFGAFLYWWASKRPQAPWPPPAPAETDAADGPAEASGETSDTGQLEEQGANA